MRIKKIITAGLISAMVVSSVPVNLPAVHADELAVIPTVVDQETKDGVTWQLYSDGRLEVSGTGSFSGDDSNRFAEAKSVAVGKGITEIGETELFGCTNLTDVTIEGENVKIGNGAFYNCSNLKNITITGSISEIGDSAFCGCSSLQDVTIPGKVESVGIAAFQKCENLANITFQDGVNEIKSSAFRELSNLKTVRILKGTTKVGLSAFSSCKNLETFESEGGLTEVGDTVFFNCEKLAEIKLAENAISIGKNAFNNCNSLKEIVIPGTVGNISSAAFEDCKGLTEVEIQDGVKNIDEYVFCGDEKIEILTLPKSAQISESAFYNCSSLKRINYTGTKEQWKQLAISEQYYISNATKVYNYVKGQHVHATFTYKRIEATCTENAKVVRTCTECGESEIIDLEGTAKGHQFSAWKTIKTATVFEAAKQTRTCSVCGETETRTTGSKLKATAKVNVTSLRLKTKQKTTAVNVTGLAKGDSIASWKSSNTSIVKVVGKSTGTSTITAGSKTGKATITITLKSGLKKTVAVTVQKTTVKTTKISGISKTLKLKKGKTATLTPIITPITSQEAVTYKSSNASVASVTSRGKITAKKKGKAVITVKSGSKSVKCTVTVQ